MMDIIKTKEELKGLLTKTGVLNDIKAQMFEAALCAIKTTQEGYSRNENLSNYWRSDSSTHVFCLLLSFLNELNLHHTSKVLLHESGFSFSLMKERNDPFITHLENNALSILDEAVQLTKHHNKQSQSNSSPPFPASSPPLPHSTPLPSQSSRSPSLPAQSNRQQDTSPVLPKQVEKKVDHAPVIPDLHPYVPLSSVASPLKAEYIANGSLLSSPPAQSLPVAPSVPEKTYSSALPSQKSSSSVPLVSRKPSSSIPFVQSLDTSEESSDSSPSSEVEAKVSAKLSFLHSASQPSNQELSLKPSLTISLSEEVPLPLPSEKPSFSLPMMSEKEQSERPQKDVSYKNSSISIDMASKKLSFSRSATTEKESSPYKPYVENSYSSSEEKKDNKGDVNVGKYGSLRKKMMESKEMDSFRGSSVSEKLSSSKVTFSEVKSELQPDTYSEDSSSSLQMRKESKGSRTVSELRGGDANRLINEKEELQRLLDNQLLHSHRSASDIHSEKLSLSRPSLAEGKMSSDIDVLAGADSQDEADLQFYQAVTSKNFPSNKDSYESNQQIYEELLENDLSQRESSLRDVSSPSIRGKYDNRNLHVLSRKQYEESETSHERLDSDEELPAPVETEKKEYTNVREVYHQLDQGRVKYVRSNLVSKNSSYEMRIENYRLSDEDSSLHSGSPSMTDRFDIYGQLSGK